MSARKWITLFPCVTLSSRVPFTLLLKSIRVNDRESHGVKQTTLAVVGFVKQKIIRMFAYIFPYGGNRITIFSLHLFPFAGDDSTDNA